MCGKYQEHGRTVILAGLIGRTEGDLLKAVESENIPALLGVDAGRPTMRRNASGPVNNCLFVWTENGREASRNLS